MATPIDAWPEGLFESIVPKLIAVLEHTQRSDSPVTPQAKQALLQATTDFKTTLAHAKDYAARLPGGETNLDEQNELIAMLEDLREHKKQQLFQFAEWVSSMLDASGQSEDIEIDSVASTPAAS